MQAKARNRRDSLAQMMVPVLWSTVVLTLMFVSTLVRFLDVSPRRSSVSPRKGSLFLSPFPLMGGMRVKILNPDQSFASSKECVNWIWNNPWARWPLLRLLRLLGNQTALDRKPRSMEAMSRR